MPTYAYACTSCGHRFEAQQSFSDAALTDCPECAGRLRKLFNNVGIVFKGSGFYRTDSRAGAGSGASEKSDAAAKSDSTSTTATSGANGSNGSSSDSKGSSGSNGASSGSEQSSSGSEQSSSGSAGASSGSGKPAPSAA